MFQEWGSNPHHAKSKSNALQNTLLSYMTLVLSVYSPSSDKVVIPLHNIPSPFLLVMDISFLSISSCALSASTLCNHVLLWSSSFNSDLHTFLQKDGLKWFNDVHIVPKLKLPFVVPLKGIVKKRKSKPIGERTDYIYNTTPQILI